MGRKIYDEDLRLNLILNGDGLNKGSSKMVAELGKLERELIDLEQKSKRLALAMNSLSRTDPDYAKKLRPLRNEYLATERQIKATTLALEDMRRKVGLMGMTVNQLKNHAKALQIQLNNMTGNPALRQRLLTELHHTEVRIRTLTTGASRLAQAWERMERAANKAGTLFGWAALVIFGLTRLVGSVITRMKELEDTIGVVRKNTNLTVGEVWEMKEAFDKWDTRTKTDDLLKLATVAGKLGIKGKEDIMKFVDSANMIQTALGDDLDGSVEDTVNSIGKLMNAFRVIKQVDKDTGEFYTIDKAMLKTGSVLNELAKSSAASAGTILNYMTRLSSVGELAGFTIDQIGGIGSALDAMNVPSERGATAVQKIMLALANPKKIDDFAAALGKTSDEYKILLKESPNQVMMDLLRKFVSTKNGLVELTGGLKDFGAKGQYMTAVIGTLAQNLDVVAEQQEIASKAWDTGTSVLEEYDIMNNNFTANVLKQQRAIRAATDQMNKDAEPAVLKLVTVWANFVVGIQSATEWIGRNWASIKSLIAAYILLKAPAIWRVSNLILEDLWLRKTYAAEALKVFWMKASVLWTRTLTVEQLRMVASSNTLRIAWVALNHGFRAALIEIQALRTAGAAMMFPYMAAAAAIAAVGAAVYLLVLKKRELTEIEKRHRELQSAIQKDFFSEKANITVMLDRLKNVNITQQERVALIRKINSEYGAYLPKLLSESATVEDLAKSYDQVVEALARKITYEKSVEAGAANRIKFDENSAAIKAKEKELESYRELHKAQLAISADPRAANVAVLNNLRLMEESLKNLRKAGSDLTVEYTQLQSTMQAFAPALQKKEIKGVLVDFPTEETFKESQEALKADFLLKNLMIKQNAIKQKLNDEKVNEQLRAAKIHYLRLQLQDMRDKYRTEDEYAEDYMNAQTELADELLAQQTEARKNDKEGGKTAKKDAAELAQDMIDIEKLRIETIKNEREKFIAEENERHRQSKEKFKENKTALAYEDAVHQQNITDINLKYLDKQLADTAVNETMKRLMLEEFRNKELISEEQYWTSKAKLEKDEAESLLEFKKQYEILSTDQLVDLEVAELRKSVYWARLTEEEKQKAIDQVELKYSRKRAQKLKKNLDDEINDIKEQFNELQHIAFQKGEQMLDIWQRVGDGMGETFAAMFEKSQDAMAVFAKGMLNIAIQEVQAYVRLQYVKMLAKNIALYGPAGVAKTGGEVMLIEAAFGLAKGLVGMINTSKKTKQKAAGSYPVVGADDGILYHASYGGSPKTGVYSGPTLLDMADGRSLVGERAPELVVDGNTFRRIQINAPGLLRDIYKYAGREPVMTKQRANGSYPTESASRPMSESEIAKLSDGDNTRLRAAIDRLNQNLENGIEAKINKYGTNGLAESINEINKFKAKVYKK